MQGFELEGKINQINSIKNRFRGVYSINTLPKNLRLYDFLFCNEDKAENEGTHWICFVKISKTCVECFDSLGINEIKKKI